MVIVVKHYGETYQSFFVLSIFPLFLYFGGNYMIPVCRDEISTRLAGAYFTLRLHVEIKFHHGKAGQFFTCYLFRFAGTFFEFFL